METCLVWPYHDGVCDDSAVAVFVPCANGGDAIPCMENVIEQYCDSFD